MLRAQKISGLLLITFCMILITTSTYPAERIVFEKGDVLYREADLPTFFKDFGHCGLYWYWEDIKGVKPNNPDDFTTHKVIESNGRWWSIFGFYTSPGVRKIIFDGDENNKDFCCAPFWGVYTASVDAAQRRLIVETAENQKGKTKYHFFWGYKSPGKSFRCDGLVEYCYEIAFGELWEPGNNGGLIPDDTWLTLKPKDQKKSKRLKERTEAEVKEARLEPSEEGILKAYASDGDKGSGITMVEFWEGMPDDTPLSEEGTGIRLGYDTHDVKYTEGDDKHTYTLVSSTIGRSLYAKAFDQAGNTKVAEALQDTCVNGHQPDRNFSNHGCEYLRAVLWGYPYGSDDNSWIVYYTWKGEAAKLHIYVSIWRSASEPIWGTKFDPIRHVDVFSVDHSDFKVSTVTWNTRPVLGSLIQTINIDLGELNALAWEGRPDVVGHGRWYEVDVHGRSRVALKLREPYGSIVIDPDNPDHGTVAPDASFIMIWSFSKHVSHPSWDPLLSPWLSK